MKFNSHICTTREQSERLISLGLKKETADMRYTAICRNPLDGEIVYNEIPSCKRVIAENILDLPAWSLHRLIEMADTTTYINEGKEDEHELWFCMDKCYCWNNHESFYATYLYDSLINCIEWLINEGYFNEEYLNNVKTE